MRQKQKLSLMKMPRPEASQAFLDQLERLRTLALEGDVHAFAFVAVAGEGDVIQASHMDSTEDLIRLMGACRILSLRLEDKYREINE